MKILHLFFLITILFVTSFRCSKQKPKTLKQWIINNQKQISLACDTIIKEYHKRNNTDSNWLQSGVAITKYAPNKLGELALKVSDSTDCIIVILDFFKNPTLKNEIMISVIDSSCTYLLQKIYLEKDTTKYFIFGKKDN